MKKILVTISAIAAMAALSTTVLADHGDITECLVHDVNTHEGFIARNKCLDDHSQRFDRVLRRLYSAAMKDPSKWVFYESYNTRLRAAVVQYRIDNNFLPDDPDTPIDKIDMAWLSYADAVAPTVPEYE